MRILLLAAATLMLAACGGPESQAVAACKAEIARKVENTSYTLDESDMAKSATREGDDMVRIQSRIILDPGTPRESKQGIDCRVRINDQGVTVISLQFIW